jgi:hypothetical protein
MAKKGDELAKTETTPEEPIADTSETAKKQGPTDQEKATNTTSIGARVKQWGAAYWAKKKLTLPLTALVLLIIILAVPFTRYETLGLFLKKPVTVTVVDSKTGAPVSSAQVTVSGKTFNTASNGKIVQQLKLGSKTLNVSKQYYQPSSQGVTVTLSAGHNSFKVALVATGRQVPVVVVNKVTGKPVANAAINVLHTEAKTDKNGKATIVLPVGASTQKGTVSVSGYNTTAVTVQVTEQAVAANTFTITPAGKLYFLSNQSGKIDVVKTNLDGTDRQTVLAGTGKEEPRETSLLASRDWKYLALLAKRGDKASVYLIDTTNGDKLTTMDEGNATFSLIGWNDDTFVYQVNRDNVSNWQPNAQALKSFNAPTGKLTVLDQTQGEGTGQYDYGFNQYSSTYLINSQVLFAKSWYTSSYPSHLDGKSVDLVSMKTDGSGKKVVKSFPIPGGTSYSYYVNLTVYEPNGIYIQTPGNPNSVYYKYEDGVVKTADGVTDQTFYNQAYPTFLQSPDNNQTFWSDQRDGKNALFVGNKEGEDKKQIATLSEYSPYGWYTDTYLLVSKNSSELYIMPSSGGTPVKIIDYYKPAVTYRGYGGGYGGF